MKRNDLFLIIILLITLVFNVKGEESLLLDLNVNNFEDFVPSVKMNNNSLSKIFPISDYIERKNLISKILTSKDVMNVISTFGFDIREISVSSITTYKYFMDEKRNF